MFQLGKKFKLKRKSFGLTQSEFSKLLGIAQGYLSEIENDVKVPSDTLVLLLDYITRFEKEESYKQKYLELAEEHMKVLKEIYLLKEQALSINDTYRDIKNIAKKTKAK
jgi:transcriptional regulator with XRE-family HTH domain